jgi:hypothetical protein
VGPEHLIEHGHVVLFLPGVELAGHVDPDARHEELVEVREMVLQEVGD